MAFNQLNKVTMGDLIRAVRCHRYAGLGDDGRPVPTPDPLSDVLSLDEVPAPECAEGHVLVSVNYAGVQYPDALQAQGLYQERPPLPYVPCMDLTGTVLEVGPGVSDLHNGDRVIAQVNPGALAEVVGVAAGSVFKAPDNVPLSKCANIGRNFFAAYHSLRVIGEIGPGDLVLVDGASGGVGMAAVELAKAMEHRSSRGSAYQRSRSFRPQSVPIAFFATGETETATRISRAPLRRPRLNWAIPKVRT